MSQEALDTFYTHTDLTQKHKERRSIHDGEGEVGSVKSHAEEVAMTPSQLLEFMEQEERKRNMEAMVPDIAYVLQGEFPVSSALRTLIDGEHAEWVAQENATHEDGDPVPMSNIALFAYHLEQATNEVGVQLELDKIHTENGVEKSISLLKQMLQVPESKFGAQKDFNTLATKLATLCQDEKAKKENDKER